MEDLPFPGHEIDFSLPETEFVGKPRRKEELEVKLKDQRDKYKEVKKEKDIKEGFKKESLSRDFKGTKDGEKKKEEMKKYVKEVDMKKDKLKDAKETRKEHKSSKGRSKGKEDSEENGIFFLINIFDYLVVFFNRVAHINRISISFLASNGKKERKDSESGRELIKRIPKRPTRQSVDSSSKASSSPRDTPPPKRRRI